jgi:hypothetical protein
MNDVPEKLTATDACVAMHTALRKQCDSAITSAAYNLIHIICDLDLPEDVDPWRLLGGFVARAVNAGNGAKLALRTAVRDGALSEQYHKAKCARKDRGEAVPDVAHHATYALECTLRCFSDDDMEGMVSYV